MDGNNYEVLGVKEKYMNLLSFLIGFASLLAHVIFVPILIRLMPKMGPITIHIFSGVCVHLLTILICMIGFIDVQYWPFTATYWLGFMVYWYIFGSFYTSMTLKTLRKLNANPSKSLKRNVIFETCFENTFLERVISLDSLGLAKIKESTMIITEKGKKIAQTIRLLNKIFGIESSGLYLVGKE